MIKNKPPCIRNLKVFKYGCPEKCWDGEYGCTAWCEVPYRNADPTQPDVMVKACIDIITCDYQLKMLKLLEGNQQAVEQLRNGLCEMINGQIQPKPDRGALHLIELMTKHHNKQLTK